jgi:hypothetical protein
MTRQNSAWSQAELDEFERLYPTTPEKELLRLFPGKSVGQMRGKAINMQLARAPTGRAKAIAADHPAAIRGETIYPGQVRQPYQRLLVTGRDQRKLGARVKRAGAWQGFPIYSLTLEERATCPASCHHWLTCYGNSMQWAVRIDASSPRFAGELAIELEELQARHPGGFVVRLHLLGDFYSISYVERWSRWLDEFPALHVFGYTAHPPHSVIGRAVLHLAARRWDRFAVRLSSLDPGPARTITAFDPAPAPRPNVITCPAETFHPDGSRKTKGCSTCGLCWHPAARAKTIRFIAHGGHPKPSLSTSDAADAVAQHGNQRAAAAALGVSLGKLQRGLRAKVVPGAS